MTGRGSANGPGSRDVSPKGLRSPAAPPDKDPPAAQTPETPGVAGPVRRVVRIVNPLGLHMRLADRFSRTARQYTCAVIVWNGDTRADGKNLIELILLSAMPDSEVVLEVDGPDALDAVDPLVSVLASPGGEDYTI